MQTGAMLHCSRNGTNPNVLLCQVHQFLSEYIRIGIRSGHFRISGFNVELGNAVIFSRIFFRRPVSFPLHRVHMHKYRAMVLFGCQQHLFQRRLIMPVYRPQIYKSKVLKHRGRVQ